MEISNAQNIPTPGMHLASIGDAEAQGWNGFGMVERTEAI